MTIEARASLRAGPSPAAIVLGVHAGALIYLLAVHEPDIVGSNMDVVTVELAPINSTPDAVEQDLAPAPETMVESQPLPDLPKPQEAAEGGSEDSSSRRRTKRRRKFRCRSRNRRRKFEVSPPPAPVTAQKVKGGAPKVEPSWQTNLMRQLQRFKRYPAVGAIAQRRRRRAIEL